MYIFVIYNKYFGIERNETLTSIFISNVNFRGKYVNVNAYIHVLCHILFIFML